MTNKIFHFLYHGIKVLLLFPIITGCTQATSSPTLTQTSTRTVPSVTATQTDTPPAPSPTTSKTLSPLPMATVIPSPTATPILAARIPIIEYHDPDFKLNEQVQMTLAWFEDQIKWLADHQYKTLDGDELNAYLKGNAIFPNKSVVLTFDVGTARKQAYTDSIIPILKRYKFKAIFFILANDAVVTDDCNKLKHFCWNDFKQWADDGVVTIASHGLFHPDFTKLTPIEIKYEVEASRKLLLKKTGYSPIGFAYPFDYTSTTAFTLIKNAGYQFAVAGNTRKYLAVVPDDPDLFMLPRVYPYSNPRIYPNLNGFNRPFSDVISELTRPGAAVNAPTKADINGYNTMSK